MSTSLYGIKVLHWGWSINPAAYHSARRHAPAPGMAAQQRQRAVTADYARRASALNAAHCGTAHGCCNGPASTALASYGGCKGIVFGAFGECSSNVDDLIAGRHCRHAGGQAMGVHGLRKLRARALRRDVGHAQALGHGAPARARPPAPQRHAVGRRQRRAAPRRRTALPAHRLPVVLGLRPRLAPQPARAREPGLSASP